MLKFLLFAVGCLWTVQAFGQGTPFEEAVVDVGNVGLTVTNAGLVGRSNVRNNPTGPPSFEYPLGSGVEHLFEAGLWIGALRADGTTQVRTGAVTTGGGYSPGASGFEFAPLTTVTERSTLPTSDAFSRQAVSHQDLRAAFADTFSVLPGTSIPMPDRQGALGAVVELRTRAWNFPFAESFVIAEFRIANASDAAWDSVYVGVWSDLVVRNVNTTQDAGGAFFNKNGIGFLDSLHATYAFNAGGDEPTLNTYGAIAVLGATWPVPTTGRQRFFYPTVADEYRMDGLTTPYVNPRWWVFSGGQAELSRPAGDQDRFDRMATPFPNPAAFTGCDGLLDTDCDAAAYRDAVDAWYQRLRTEGQNAQGNWIGLTSIGPFPTVAPGDTLTVTYAFVGALKPEAFQGDAFKSVDTPESRALLRANIGWGRRTFAGEDADYDGELDPGEDINGNGVLDRYLIPEPPPSPDLRVELEPGRAILYWTDDAETARDPVSGEQDFEGYRIYRSNPGDDRGGNILDRATLIAQYDQPGNATGFNNGLDEIRLDEPVTFPGDPNAYRYRFVADGLLSGWQYLFTVTAFDQGEADAGLPSFESSRTQNAARVFPGAAPAADARVGVYPNPYRVNAAWDGGTSRTRKLYFYNLPARADIRIYTLAGEIVDELRHEADGSAADVRWYDTFSAPERRVAGGERAWDLLSGSGLNLATGLYLFTVRDLDSGEVQSGKFSIIK